jgi:hypothetical protein
MKDIFITIWRQIKKINIAGFILLMLIVVFLAQFVEAGFWGIVVAAILLWVLIDKRFHY